MQTDGGGGECFLSTLSEASPNGTLRHTLTPSSIFNTYILAVSVRLLADCLYGVLRRTRGRVEHELANGSSVDVCDTFEVLDQGGGRVQGQKLHFI